MYSDKSTESNVDMNQSRVLVYRWYIVENDELVLNTNSQAYHHKPVLYTRVDNTGNCRPVILNVDNTGNFKRVLSDRQQHKFGYLYGPW